MAEENDNLMDPENSPGAGVRRVNNMPMYILFGVGAAFLLMMLMVAMDRAHKNTGGDGDEDAKKSGNTMMFAQEIVGDHDAGMIEPDAPTIPELPAPETREKPLPPQQIVRTERLPPPPDAPAALPPPEKSEENPYDKIRRRLFEQAIKARTGVGAGGAGGGLMPGGVAAGGGLSGGSGGITLPSPAALQDRLERIRSEVATARSSGDPTAAYQAVRTAFSEDGEDGYGGGGAGGSMGMDLLPSAASSGPRTAYSRFDNTGNGDRWRLDSQVQKPRSRFELRAGFVMPATLISGINSDLPGQIIAQISQNIWDTPTGRYLLIPQGSRLVGTYSSSVQYGQNRVLIAWQRIIFPDGKALDIGSMPGADSAGYSGFKDQVHNHYFRMFASAILMSAITAGIAYNQDKYDDDDDDSDSDSSMSSAMSEALGNQLGQVTAKMIEKNMDISPTLVIRPGYRFNVMVTKDITFTKPYRSFDY